MKSNSNAMEQVTMAPIFPPGTGLGMKTLHNISERPKSDENASQFPQGNCLEDVTSPANLLYIEPLTSPSL